MTNARDRRREQGGSNYHLKYNRLLGQVLVEASYSRHNGEVSDFAVVPGPSNSIVFREADARTLADEQLGGFGLDDVDQRDTEGYKGTAVVQVGDHALHGGVELLRNSNFRDTVYDGGLYTSLAAPLAGLTAGDLVAGSFSSTRFDPTNSSDHGGFIRTVDRLPDRAAFYTLYDGDGDGTITQDELAARLAYDSTAGNPHGAVNYERLVQTALGAQETRSDGLSFFVQDTFSAGRHLSFNLGLRTERFAHFATDGTNIFTFDWTLAPRLSVSYDPTGGGRQRISAFYGKYYDPIRNNLTNFAGTVTGSVREEQVYANDQWVTYRVRGGPQQADAPVRADHADPLDRRSAVELRDGSRRGPQRARAVHEAAHARHHRGLRHGALRHAARRVDELSGARRARGLALPRPRLLRLRRLSRVELRHRDPRRRRARLPGRGAHVPAAAAEQLAGAGRVHVRPRHRQHQLRFERRLPGRRDLARPAGSPPVGRPARLDRAPVQDQLVVLLGQRIPDRRQLALELGHARQPDVPGVRPQPAAARRAGRGVRVCRRQPALALAARGGRAPQPVLRQSSTSG